MRKSIGDWMWSRVAALVMCAAVCAAVLAVGGCADEAAQQRAEAIAALEEASDLLKQANQGFVPRGESQGEAFTIDGETYHWPDLASRRERLLGQAIDKLQSSEIRAASPQLRNTAQEVLSLAYAMQAQTAQRKAVGAYSRFAADSGSLIAQALALSIARQRDNLFQGDYEPVITTYETQERQERAESTDLQSQNEAMRQRIDRLAQQSKQAQARRDELMAQVGALRQESFLAQGDRYFEALDQAARLEVRADEMLAEAQKHESTQDVLAAELAIADTRREQADQAAQVMQDQAKLMRDMQQLASEQRAAAQQDQTKLNQELMTLLEQFSTRFESEIEGAFDVAIEQIERAIDAAPAGGGSGLLNVREDRQLAMAAMLAERTIAEGAFARTLMLAISAAGEESQAASVFADKIARLNDKQQEHAQTAQKALDELAEAVTPALRGQRGQRGQDPNAEPEADPQTARLQAQIEALREQIRESLTTEPAEDETESSEPEEADEPAEEPTEEDDTADEGNSTS